MAGEVLQVKKKKNFFAKLWIWEEEVGPFFCVKERIFFFLELCQPQAYYVLRHAERYTDYFPMENSGSSVLRERGCQRRDDLRDMFQGATQVLPPPDAIFVSGNVFKKKKQLKFFSLSFRNKNHYAVFWGNCSKNNNNIYRICVVTFAFFFSYRLHIPNSKISGVCTWNPNLHIPTRNW